MKRRKGRYVLNTAVIVVLALGTLTGCCEEEKTVDYNIEGITAAEQSQSEEIGGSSGLNQFKDEGNWKETWMCQVGFGEWQGIEVPLMADMEVNAEVIVPRAEQMSVIEVIEPEFDAEFKEQVAENIFASGEIYYKDPSHLPKKELQKVKNYFDEVGEISIRFQSYPYSVRQLQQKLEELQAAVENIESAKETYTAVEEYTVNEYMGLYEGREYDLTFAERPGDASSDYRRFKRITMEVQDLYEVCPEQFKEQDEITCSPWMLGDWGENQCELSEEEALKVAKAFVEQTGLDYPVYSFCYPLLWGDAPKYVTEESSSEGWGIDGYVFVFDMGVDDISFVNYGMEEDYYSLFVNSREGTDSDKEIRYSLNARLQIYVTDKGIIRMIADNPLELVGVSEGVTLLPLTTIKSMIKGASDEHWEMFNGKYGSDKYFDTLELIYFRVRDKENPGRYSYVPVWRLGTVTRNVLTNEISIVESIMINAIDGSAIDYYDET